MLSDHLRFDAAVVSVTYYQSGAPRPSLQLTRPTGWLEAAKSNGAEICAK